jgi:hypothetical protein
VRSKLDFEQWGGLNAELDFYSFSQENLVDGIYKINFGSNSVYIRFTNLAMIDLSSNLLFCLNAATSGRGDKNPPFFSGGNLANSIKRTLISISDDSTHIEGLDLGWYLGNESFLDFSDCVSNIIQNLAKRFHKKIVMFGGSGGGFASLMLSLKLSVPATIIAMNPQLDISKYPTASNYIKLGFQQETSRIGDLVENIAQWKAFFAENTLMTEVMLKDLNPRCEYLLFQAWNDTHHLNNHIPNVLPEINKISLSTFHGSKDNLHFLLGPWGDRHSVVWREHLEELLHRVLNSESSAEVVTKMAYKFLSEREIMHGDSRFNFPPTHMFENGTKLNLIRVNLEDFFSKNDALRNEVYSMQFLQHDLNLNQSSLDPFALLAFFKCWMGFEDDKQSELPEIMSFENLSGRINVLVFLIIESAQRSAMSREAKFLKNIFEKYRTKLELLKTDERMELESKLAKVAHLVI